MVGVGDLQLDFTLRALVNDALMAIFFFAVGLEVRREFAIGELTSWSRAMVAVAAAIAGLVVPCPCRKPRPHRSGGMLVLVETSHELLLSSSGL